ncbi:MAG: endolytic transglycosylase MltG [Gammaproteobacteria bacterium]
MLNKYVCLGWIVLAGSFLAGWLWMDYQSAITVPVVDETIYIEVEKGDSLQRITQKLLDADANIKPIWFKLYAYRHQIAGRLKAGDYEISKDATVPDIFGVLISGKSRQYSITFPEGLNFHQFIQLIKNNAYLKKTVIDLDGEAILSQLGSELKHPEGLFFPDTYFFEKNTTDLALLARAYQRMQDILAEEWRQKQEQLPLDTPYQALILASIIEKETGMSQERPLISGVFIRRLEKGMLLQTDPTVIYGMGESFDGDIKSQDLKAQTPYNTYIIKGLPPTPIAMPGRESIHAALHPTAGKELYFVGKGDGSHYFSTTLKQHNKAVALYQLNNQSKNQREQ